MSMVFADTLYWLAIVRPADSWREPSRRARAALGRVRLVTTDDVFAEFLAAVSSGGPVLRRMAVETVRMLLTDPDVTVVAQSRESFLNALSRYAQREDKDYSLTDCSAMNAMDALGIRDILTNDHHFLQEGYNVLIDKP